MEQHNEQEEIGPLLRKLRGDIGLREVGRRTGISNSYLSQIERGDRRPGPSVLKRLAALYDVDVQDLLKRAGFLDEPEGIETRDDEPEEVERAYQYVLADPKVPGGHPALRPPVPGGQAVHRADVRTIHRQADSGMTMTMTFDDFCDRLMADDHPMARLERKGLRRTSRRISNCRPVAA